VPIFGKKGTSCSTERCEWTELRPTGLYGPLAAGVGGFGKDSLRVCSRVTLANVRPVRLAVAQAGCDLLARAQAQLLEDACHVMVHRALAEHEL
jgi:hypothetical protein